MSGAGADRPHARLLAKTREADLDGRELPYADSAKLLLDIAGDPVELNALLEAIATTNDPTRFARLLHRHARKARSELDNEILRLDHREASLLFWGQSIGATFAAGASGWLVLGAAVAGPVAVLAGGVTLFGVATRERILAGKEKERLRAAVTDLSLLDGELEAQQRRLQQQTGGGTPRATR